MVLDRSGAEIAATLYRPASTSQRHGNLAAGPSSSN
jgi:hypothetical protein